MHTNPAFRKTSESRALALARDRAFGTITLAGPDGILASHVPFAFQEDIIRLHFTRSNPIARHLRGGQAEALLIVSGPDGYVSPDWYEVDDQVPTWNYVAVHIRGPLTLLPDEELRPHLEHISDEQETRLAPKPVWTMDKMSDGVAERMMRMIVPAQMNIRDVESTFKLNQNKPEAVRLRASDAIESIGNSALAALMREPTE